jgi:hypothetical protein
VNATPTWRRRHWRSGACRKAQAGYFPARGMATLSMDGSGQEDALWVRYVRISGPRFQRLSVRSSDGRNCQERAHSSGWPSAASWRFRAAAAVENLVGVVSINGLFDLGSFPDSLPAIYRDNMCYALRGSYGHTGVPSWNRVGRLLMWRAEGITNASRAARR